MDLKNKTAVITGGSRGIGLAIAKKLAENGADIAILYVGDEAEGNNAVAELAPYGVKTAAYFCDVSDFEASKKAVETVIADFGGIDILINNAGITRDKLALRMTDDDFETVLAVNLTGAFRVSRYFLRGLMKKRAGRIINIASVVGLTGNPGQANYVASKAGLIGLTKTLAREIGSRGVTVNAVAPGFIETRMTEALSEEVRQQILSTVPLNRFGTARDVAGAVLYLASDAAGYVSGVTLSVNGALACH